VSWSKASSSWLRNLIAPSIPPNFDNGSPPPSDSGSKWKRAESVCVDRLGITHTPVEPQHFHFQSCARYEQTNL
jgi:hypothetical protein